MEPERREVIKAVFVAPLVASFRAVPAFASAGSSTEQKWGEYHQHPAHPAHPAHPLKPGGND